MPTSLILHRSAALGGLLLLAACSGSQPAAAIAPAKVSVQTLVARAYTQTSSLPGRTTAYLTAEVRPQISGIVQKRLFTEGADVHAGQLLYQIDPATYQATYDSAQAALAKATAAVLAARPQAARDSALRKIDAVSQETLDSSVATLRQDQAAVQSAKADLQSARINLAYTRITAPIDGRIGASTYTPGALVTADQTTALTTIYQFDPIYVDVTQSSAQFLQLRQELASGRLKTDPAGGARIQLQLEDGSTYAHEGRLQFAGVAVDQTTGSITLRALLPNPDKLLLPGMYVHAVIEQGIDASALRVPQQAVTRNIKGQATALVVNAQNKVEQRVLSTGATDGAQWIVKSGVKAGERVIVEGGQNVKAGDTVQPEEYAAGSSAATSAAAPAHAASAH